MRIMWTVFVTFPEVAGKINKKAEYACTWARALSEALRKRDDVALAIVSIADCDEVKRFDVNGVAFYFLPNERDMKKNGGGVKARNAWKEVIADFNPDIIHVHGSESMVPYELIMLHPDVPVYLTLQGILSNYFKDDYAGIDMKDIVINTSLRDFVRHSGMILDRKKTKDRSKFEREMLLNIQYVGGRTTWDRVTALSINPSAKYFYAPEMIRREFYDVTRWEIQNVKRHRIFMHQGFKPIKGLHIMLDAMVILRNRYPDLQLYMSGTNVMKNTTFKEKLLQPGYVKYLFKKIQEYKLGDCIHYTGVLNANQIVDELKKSHVMVLPSAIENSPNSLSEAQLIGIPCVASHVGGVPEMMKDGIDGFLYTFNEPLMLAEYISRIFESDELAESVSRESYRRVHEKQNSEIVIEKTMENYNEIIKDWNGIEGDCNL